MIHSALELQSVPQQHSADSCLEGSFLVLLENHQEPNPGLSDSRDPP